MKNVQSLHSVRPDGAPTLLVSRFQQVKRQTLSTNSTRCSALSEKAFLEGRHAFGTTRPAEGVSLCLLPGSHRVRHVSLGPWACGPALDTAPCPGDLSLGDFL